MTPAIRQHEVPPGADSPRCRWCGALKPGPESTCILRVGTGAAEAPEPQRRQYACEDGDEISARLADLREAARQMCPINTARTLHACLRSASPCTDSCPLKADWIGPEPARPT